MSDPNPNPDPPAASGPEAKKTPAPPAKGAPVVLIAVIASAAVAGVVLGSVLVGPQLIRARDTKPAAHAEAADDAGEKEEPAEKPHGGKEEKKRRPVVRLENLIVNPAGSGGSRFLMTTVAIEVPSERLEAKLREQDDDVRDRVIAVLQRHDTASLSTIGVRDTLKREIAECLAPVLGKATQVRVYLPQFVLQ